MNLPKWLRAILIHKTELPCGCVVTDSATPRFSDRVTELARDSVEVGVKRYENATVYDDEWAVRYECDQCGSRWTDRENAGRRTDFGEENPGAGVELEIRHRPGFMRSAWIHEEVPVVEDPDND